MPDQYWRTDGNLHAAGPGLKIFEPQDIDVADERTGRPIGVIRAPQNFQAYTQECLNLLYRTNTGQTALNVLVATTTSIAFSNQGNTAGVGNAQASMTLVAHEILHVGRPGVASLAAMQQGFGVNNAILGVPNHQETARRLGDAINQQPRWRIDVQPGAGYGLGYGLQSIRDYANRWLMWSSDPTEGYFDNQLITGAMGRSGAGLAMTQAETLNWMRHGTVPQRLSAENQQQLKLATVVALEPHSQRGPGSPSSVRFAIDEHDVYRHQRPPAIALGHELVHAYFSARGEQPGEEYGHFSTVLFEFKCVGLGPWNEHANSENGLRSQWPGVLAHVAQNDIHNRQSPGKRIRY